MLGFFCDIEEYDVVLGVGDESIDYLGNNLIGDLLVVIGRLVFVIFFRFLWCFNCC